MNFKERNVLIITNNEVDDNQRKYQFRKYFEFIKNQHFDKVYFVDGGFCEKIHSYFEKQNTEIYFVGDFDSNKNLKAKDIENLHILNKDKDDTDFYYCLKLIDDIENTNLYVFNLIGGRFSMSLANVFIFRKLFEDTQKAFKSVNFYYFQNKIQNRGFILYPNQSVCVDKYVCKTTRINVLSLSDKTEDVEILNLYYHFKGQMKLSYPIGISNKTKNKDNNLIKNNKDGLLLILLED